MKGRGEKSASFSSKEHMFYNRTILFRERKKKEMLMLRGPKVFFWASKAELDRIPTMEKVRTSDTYVLLHGVFNQ
jgi:hypothetical protein